MRHCDTTRLSPAALLAAAGGLLTDLGDAPSAHGRMQMAYACGCADGELDVLYVLSQGANQPYKVWRVRPEDRTLPSLANKLPLLGWYEREMMDLYGLRFTDHPEPNPLVLHEGMPREPAPLSHGFDRDAPALDFSLQPPTVPQVLGPDIQRLPFGPVRADIVESAQFLFFYIGEGILHYHPRLFYKHRAMEARFQGADRRTGAVLAERVSGIDSVAHGLAYAQAVEGAMGWRAPPRARYLRVILAELERLYNHLHYLGHLSKTTTLKVGEAEGHLLEERVKQINGPLTGSRFLRGLITPGGLRRDLDISGLDKALDAISDEIDRYLQRLEATRSHLDRLMTTGVLPRQMAFDQGATGPIERASNLDRDLRRDHPYANYEKVRFSVPVQQGGDAHARSLVRMEEIRESLAIIRQTIGRTKPGAVLRFDVMEEPDPQGEGLGWAEATRGGLLCAVHLTADRTRLQRVKIKDPSFSNWRVFPFTVEDSNMMDYAINEASFGLSIAGADR
ncbi:NADH-quinone oxidoreductase subunit C [Thiomonas sp. FB-Cd]|uniref:Putative NADH dehydrogenase n=1 Tax=mine drainage metagenome TaxID=410659 RepID=E6PP06_9ZZZZ|nr:NADH-quinone oxidoreductase subunit C [Thiomonas sp. FB-Cd]